jgi:hypothetical protein
MKHAALTQDDTRQRGLKVDPRLEVAVCADHDVGGNSCPAQGSVADLAGPCLWGNAIWDHNEQVVVAIRAVVAARLGTEQVDALGSIGVPQAAHRLGKSLVGEERIDSHAQGTILSREPGTGFCTPYPHVLAQPPCAGGKDHIA